MFLFRLLLGVAFILVLYRVLKFLVIYVPRRRRFLKMPGPPEDFLFRHMIRFTRVKQEYLFQYARDLARDHWPIYRLSGFFMDAVNVLTPEDIEICISSMKNLKKSPFYRMLYKWLGTGLLTSTGSKWQARRKILTPAFHFSILQEFLTIFNEETEKFVNQLEVYVDKDYVEIGPHITQMTLQTISESAMGFNNIEEKSTTEYKQSIYGMGKIYVARLQKPWLIVRSIYNRTSFAKKERYYLKILHSFTNRVIREREQHFISLQGKNKTVSENSYFGRKRLAMLDLLLAVKWEEGLIDNEGIREEVDTFMFEGHDTVTSAMTFLLFALANYEHIQQKVFDEIYDVLGPYEKPPTYNELQELKYTERVIKETLRLYPSVPFISRTTSEDFTTATGYFVPMGTVICIHIFDLHRHPDIYPDPLKFDPDRFLPENCQNRHPFAYLPFSAGPRNCIGQKFSILELKAVLCGVLRKYHLVSVDKPCDIEFSPDMILRTKKDIKIKLEYRN